MPRSLRDSAPPKPRFVPPQLRKDTPAVAIQAMRIIAIGADESPRSALPQPSLTGALNQSVEGSTESLQSPPTKPSLPAPVEIATEAPPLPDAALQEFPPIPDGDIEDAPPPVPAAIEQAPAVSALNELELYPLTGQAPRVEVVPQAIPDDDVATIESERTGTAVVADDAAAVSVRKRPPPPKRVSVPSVAGDGQTDELAVAAATVSLTTSERPAAGATGAAGAAISLTTSERPALARPVAVVTTEVAPRQPPPAPSRVPRDSVPKQLAKPELPERSESASRKPEPPERKSEDSAAESEEKPRGRGAAPRRLWWDELFGEDFSRAVTRLSDAQIDQEASFIEESLGMAQGAVVLDLGCGAGYHAVELASRGYGIVGYDLSLHQLSLAQEVAHERGQKLNFLQGDMREMAFEEVFDGMYCWNTTFGYFEEEKNVQVAQRMFAALKPGGTLLLDVANRDFVAMNQPSSVWYEGDSCVCMDDMSVDFFTSRLRVKRSLILDDGRTRECHYSIRLYSLHELGRILHDIGFRVTEASGHPSTPGVFLGQSSPRIIILAQRP